MSLFVAAELEAEPQSKGMSRMRCHCQLKIARYSPSLTMPYAMMIGCILLLTCLSLLVGCASGFQATCAPYLEHKRRAIITFNARSEAKQTWDECYADQQTGNANAADAKHGFITGYVETAFGFVNSPPPVPPRPCISIHTLAETYPDAGAWYSGYHQGVASALSKGVDQWRLAPIDPGLLQSQCESQVASLSHYLPLEQRGDVMIDEDQYSEPKHSAEPRNELPPPREPKPWLQQNNELIMKPIESDSL